MRVFPNTQAHVAAINILIRDFIQIFLINFLEKSSKVLIYLPFSDTISFMEDNYNASTFELQDQSKIFGENAFARIFAMVLN